jgi:TP901 family phage tail tape measure protein
MAMNQFGAGFIIDAKDSASGVFRSVGKNFAGMTRQASGEANRMQGAIRRISRGMAVFAAGFAIVRPIQNALKESTKLSSALAEVATLTDDATFPLSRMDDIVKGLAARYGEQATDQAKALYQTISAGFGDAAEAARILDTSNKLAIGGVTDVQTAVDGLTNVLNTYSAANLDALDVSDAFFVAVKAGKTTIGELAGQVGRIAPAAEALKIPFDQMLGSMAAITTKGISTAAAASGLAGAIANINKPTQGAQEEAKRLGIQFDAAAVRAKGLSGFLDSITSSAKFNDDSMSKLFTSIEAYKVMLALTSNESEKFNEIMGQMEERVGATDTAVAKMEATFEHQSKRLAAIANNIQTTIGKSAEALLAPVLKVLNFAVEGVSSFLDSLPPGARKAIVGFVGAFGGLVGVMGLVMAFSGVLSLLGISITGLVGSLVGLVALAVPLTLMFAGLGVAVFALYRAFQKNTGGISTSWADMMQKIKFGWRGMMQIVSEGGLSKAFRDEMEHAQEFGVLRFLDGFKLFVERLQHFWDGLIKGFETGVDKLAGSAGMRRLRTAIDAIVSLFTGKKANDSQKTLIEWERKGERAGVRLAELGEIALNALAKVVELGGALSEAVGKITAEDITTGIDNATTSFKDMWGVLKDIVALFGALFNAVRGIVNLIQFVGAGLGEITAQVISMDFGELTETRKQLNEFLDSIGSSARVDVAVDFQYPEITAGEFAQAGQLAPGVAGRASADQISRAPRAWTNPPQGIEEARSLREDIIKFMTTSTRDWRAKNPHRYSFQEASVAEKAWYRTEVRRLERMIRDLSNRPINVNIDGEKMAESVKESDEATGSRIYDEDPSFGL